MGCASSKLDDLPAVALCKERCTYLDDAIRKRYALAEAHISYMHSLKGIGNSLQEFFEHGFIVSSSATVTMSSPVLNLPPKTKGGGGENSKEQHGGALSSGSPLKVGAKKGQGHSNPGSHLDFHDSDGDDEDDDGFLHHSDMSTPLHDMGGHIPYYGGNYGGNMGMGMGMSSDMIMGSYPFPAGGGGGGGGYGGGSGGGGYGGGSSGGGYGGGSSGGGYGGGSSGGGYGGGSSSGGSYMHMNYMKNKGTTPSIVYEQRPMNQTVYIGESSSQSSHYKPYHEGGSSNPYGNNNSGPGNPYGYDGYSNYGSGPSGPSGGYYGMPPNYGGSSMGPSRMEVASSSKPPPPPPSPPKPSAWDFLDFFGGDETNKYYSMYTPSRNSKDLREEEGIPDLEDEREEIKEVYGASKIVDTPHYAKSVVVDDDRAGKVDPAAAIYQTGPSESVGSVSDTDEEEYVEKKVVDREVRSEDHGNSQGLKAFRSVDEVLREIKVQFERASQAGSEIVSILEVGKVPYRRKHQVASKLTHGAAPSLSIVSQPSTSVDPSASGENVAPASQEEEVGLRLKNLSSTLQKLYLWEKKLYNEVKAEEKMRVIHDGKVQKLKRLDERGAEAQKVESTRNLIRSLSTKIRMAIQVVDKISITINKIRDEELWPQLNDLIQGFARMWKAMLDCHRTQCQVIKEAKSLMPVGSGKKFGDAHLEVMLQFQREVINWTYRFTIWVSAQKGYVKALNGWLVKCLLYEPEETPDGPVPFSPGRMGAPPVFVICNQWSQAMDRISEKEVIESMRVFASSVFQLWERDKGEVRQSIMGTRDSERKVKNLDREDQKIQKEIQALDKKLVLFTGDGDGLPLAENVVYQSDISSNNLQGGLQRIFEAMEKFTTDSLKAYEELLERTQEETQARDR